MHVLCIHAIPTWRVYRLSDNACIDMALKYASPVLPAKNTTWHCSPFRKLCSCQDTFGCKRWTCKLLFPKYRHPSAYMGFKGSLLQFLGPDNWMFSFSTEDYRLWNLVTSYHGFYFLSFLQTNSLLQALTQAGLAPDCVEETLYLANIFISDTCKLLAYKWHLSTQPPSDHEGRYNSKWLHSSYHPMQPDWHE